jgi:cysteine sulfinate desulfinase/cysteine desulfurase-like protein
MGLIRSEIEGNLRISFSKYNTIYEIDKLSDVLINVVKKYLSKVK